MSSIVRSTASERALVLFVGRSITEGEASAIWARGRWSRRVSRAADRRASALRSHKVHKRRTA